MPPQITRLAIVTLAIVVLYFTARYFLVPGSFGKYGWYRGDAVQEIAALPVTFAGKKTCAECHTDQADKLSKAGHKTLSCESCHGPLNDHAQDPTIEPAKITDLKFCIRCHAENSARPEKFPQVSLSTHYPESNCTECHQPHQPMEVP